MLPLEGEPLAWTQTGCRCGLIWQLFKLYMRELHPLFGLFYRYDIDLARVDRAAFLATRLVLCYLISYLLMGSYRLNPKLGTEEIFQGLTEEQLALYPQAVQ